MATTTTTTKTISTVSGVLSVCVAAASVFIALTECPFQCDYSTLLMFVPLVVFAGILDDGRLALSVAMLYVILLWKARQRRSETSPATEPFTVKAHHRTLPPDAAAPLGRTHAPVACDVTKVLPVEPVDEQRLRNFVTPELLHAAQSNSVDPVAP